MFDLLKEEGYAFDDALSKEIKDKFYNVDSDPFTGKKRLFFENAGGAFRLKKVVEEMGKLEGIPDCPERVHKMALYLQDVQEKGEEDIRVILNAGKSGSIITSLTASQIIFQLLGTIAESVPGTNIVTSQLEHPSAYDAAYYYAKKTNKSLRPVKTNPKTGGVDVEDVLAQIDCNTCVLSVLYASNISGAIMDIKAMVEGARAIKPDLFIVVDAVQHAPHGVIDVQDLQIDAVNFAPYKFFGNRGSGIGWVSDRLATLPHHRFLASPDKNWEVGSPAPSQFAAISEIVNYVCWLGAKFRKDGNRRELFVEGMNRIKMHERAMMYRLLEGSDKIEGLRHMKGVSTYLDDAPLSTRDFIVAMGIDNMDYTATVREYEKRDITVYERIDKSLYSKRMLKSFGMKGCLRISPLHCHTAEDVDFFLQNTKEIASKV